MYYICENFYNMENNYVVYKHLKSNGDLFYIGMGNRKRPYAKSGRSKYWKNTVDKYGKIVEIIHDNLTYDEAKHLEITYIFIYGRKDQNRGCLINFTDGGEGASGVKRSAYSIQKFKETISNWTDEQRKSFSEKVSKSQKGKVISDKERKRLSDINIGNQHCLGRTYTDEQKLNLSIKNKGKEHIFKDLQKLKNCQKTQFKIGSTINNKKVINIETGEIWDSAKICHEKEQLQFTVGHFRDMMSGLKKNKTNYKYLKDYGKE